MTTTPWTLADLEAAIRAGWSAETCSPDDVERAAWTPENPAWGHCDITALLVHDLLGGELMAGEVWLDGRQEGVHVWNELPGGIVVDLTRERFRRGQVVSPGWKLGERPAGRTPRRWEEYQTLRRRVIDKLGPLPGTVRAQDGTRLRYLDHGGTGGPLLALHGDGATGAYYARRARELGGGHRLVTLDRRGYGASDRAGAYGPERCVADAELVLESLGLGPAVVLGHGTGGVVAYRLAARRPDLVRAVVVEDAGAVVSGEPAGWVGRPRRAPGPEALRAAWDGPAAGAVEEMRRYPDGWGPAFEPADAAAGRAAFRGDHWEAWLAVRRPTLLLRGDRSRSLSGGHAREMALRRPGVRLVELPAGHRVLAEDPRGWGIAVRGFLAGSARGLGSAPVFGTGEVLGHAGAGVAAGRVQL
ncbi:alpha/beta fold hydrolase [Streptomyces sp. BI20]|uniref:alpha/beta fold hydrolase n=1 Tax=Streptomyces sp. BI20 TaxID=3403460 RepID=UPI003C7160D1